MTRIPITVALITTFALGVAFDVVERVQANRLTHSALQLPPSVVGNQDFVLERNGFDGNGGFADANEFSGYRDDHVQNADIGPSLSEIGTPTADRTFDYRESFSNIGSLPRW